MSTLNDIKIVDSLDTLNHLNNTSNKKKDSNIKNVSNHAKKVAIQNVSKKSNCNTHLTNQLDTILASKYKESPIIFLLFGFLFLLTFIGTILFLKSFFLFNKNTFRDI